MDSFRLNLVAMGILGSLFFVIGLTYLTDSIYYSKTPHDRSFVIAEVDAHGGGEAAEADTGPAFDPVTPLLASADAAAGEKEFRKCAACHTVDQGGANKVGPNLWDIVNRAVASHDGFSYSSALQEYGAEKGWNYESLNGFLWKPKTYVRGTSMGFVGIKKVEDRANIIAYLRSLSDSPAPLPEAGGDSAASSEGAAASTD